jgi:hypothetical protein
MGTDPRDRGLVGRGPVHSALLVALLLLLAACGSPQPAAEPAGHSHDDAEGVPLAITDHLPDAGLAELSRASELVVLGRVVGAVEGVRIGSDASAGYTILTVAVEEALKGTERLSGDAPAKTVEVAMLTHLDGAPVAIAGRPTPAIDDRGVWLLQPIAPEFDRRGYVLTNQNSQILVDEHGLTGGVPSAPSAKEVAQLGDLPSVLDRIRAQGS